MDQPSIRRAALNLLARRDHTLQELHRKLSKKKYPEEMIHQVLTGLTQQGLINEQRFTCHYIEWRRSNGHGPKRIEAELKARGISPAMIANELNIADNVWLLAVSHTWHKRFKGQLPKDVKNKLKQMRFLQYRGFTQEQIESLLKFSLLDVSEEQIPEQPEALK